MHKDRQARRAWDRERQARKRALARGEVALAVPAITKVILIEDVQLLLGQAAQLCLGDPKARGTEKARTLCQVAAVALKVIEARDLQERVAALEQVLRMGGPA